jgi:transposase
MCSHSEGSCQQTIEDFRQQLQLKDQEIDSLKQEVAMLREQVRQLLHRLYGASSERSAGNVDQSTDVADGSDNVRDSGAAESGNGDASNNRENAQNKATNDVVTANDSADDRHDQSGAQQANPKQNGKRSGKKPRGGGRKPLPKHLPRVPLLLAYAKNCAGCGSVMRILGERRVEKLAVLPLLFYVIEYIYTHTACPCCDDNICCPPAEPSLVPSSQATPELLADLAINKVADGLPINRQDKRAKRSTCPIGRAKLNRWFIHLGLALAPFIKLLVDAFNTHHTGHIDETRLHVIKEVGKKSKQLSALFIRTGGPPKRPVMLVDYRPDKNEKTVFELLADFTGRNLVADMATAFKNFVKQATGITLFACHDHCRRKFKEALKAIPLGHQKDCVAAIIVELYKQLYAVERQAKGRSPRVKKRLRQRSRKILNRMYRIMDVANARPKSSLGKAIAYAKNHKTELYAYLSEPQAPISNILAEHVAKKIAVARKNFLFSFVANGAEALANIMTVVYTLELYPQHHLHSYLTVLFLELPKAETIEELEALLPWNITPEEVARRVNQRPKPFGISAPKMAA